MNFGLIQKHPLATGAVVVIGGLGLFLAVKPKGGGGAAPAAPAGGVPQSNQAAAIAAATQLATVNAQATAQANELQAQLTAQAQDEQTQITLANLAATTSTQQQVNAITGSQNLAITQADVEKFGISTQAAVENARTAAAVQSQAGKP